MEEQSSEEDLNMPSILKVDRNRINLVEVAAMEHTRQKCDWWCCGVHEEQHGQQVSLSLRFGETHSRSVTGPNLEVTTAESQIISIFNSVCAQESSAY
ncbi:hypothetical protein NL676_000873 [Syzygium grande]|nr:hypothetical protein NL676_000873 [Syzygium grande]